MDGRVNASQMPRYRESYGRRIATREHDPEKSGDRFSLATNAESVCAEIMLK
jgi:hypothetical protein